MVAYALEHGGLAQVTAVMRSNYDAAVKNGIDIDSVQWGQIKAWKPSPYLGFINTTNYPIISATALVKSILHPNTLSQDHTTHVDTQTGEAYKCFTYTFIMRIITMTESHGSEVEVFLDDLPPSTNRYTYEGKEQLHQILKIEYDRLGPFPQSEPSKSNLEISEYFVIFIDPSSFDQEFLLPDPIAGLRLFYNAALHTLILRMSTPEHSRVAGALHTAISIALLPMELDEAIQVYGGVNVPVGNGNVKQPDGGWGPIRHTHGVPKRPGVVVEVGVSEPETKLRNDARMWVDPVRGEAKMAITVKVNPRKSQLKIDTWEWDEGIRSPHATQSCVIERFGDKTTVSHHPITIPFEYIFRRCLDIPREADIRLEKQRLINMATSVWAAQEL
ncbi:hypothetical protein ACN42_g7850 [Penicillium freii]|uniref:Uncharacterized protein n=1 Tax=Penicillium freii TaxID=48697 RepID=A0A101MET2_PENFR|nr:hypothetical protein ACN42_g7850 [Penicillium freii]